MSQYIPQHVQVTGKADFEMALIAMFFIEIRVFVWILQEKVNYVKKNVHASHMHKNFKYILSIVNVVKFYFSKNTQPGGKGE